MAEDTRLNHSTEMFYVKNQSNHQSNQSQLPQQTIHTEKLLKQTEDDRKPISKILNTKSNKIRQTMDYNMYELKEKRGIRWVNLDKNKALTGIQMRYKATTTNEQSAFKGYVNSDAITNIRLGASRHYSISNTKIWDWKNIYWGNRMEWRFCYRSLPFWRAKRRTKM